MSIDNGGPAFPTENGRQVGPDAYHYEGISTRDYFAAKAMASILNQPEWEEMQLKDVASWAYEYADAMIAERNKP